MLRAIIIMIISMYELLYLFLLNSSLSLNYSLSIIRPSIFLKFLLVYLVLFQQY